MAKKGGAFMRPVQPDDVLAEIIGGKARPRTEVVADIWKYIKKHGLQDDTNKRMINSGDDDAFKAFAGGKKQVSMFDLAKLVGKHVS